MLAKSADKTSRVHTEPESEPDFLTPRIRREKESGNSAWILELKDIGEELYNLMDPDGVDAWNEIDQELATSRMKRSYRVAQTASLKIP